MSWKYWILMGCLLSTLLTTMGCSTVYRSPGAEKSPISKLAILSRAQRNVSIGKVDGKRLHGATINRLELVPGTRSITVYLFSSYTQPYELAIEFEARAGEQYELNAEFNVERWQWKVTVVQKGSDLVISEQITE